MMRHRILGMLCLGVGLGAPLACGLDVSGTLVDDGSAPATTTRKDAGPSSSGGGDDATTVGGDDGTDGATGDDGGAPHFADGGRDGEVPQDGSAGCFTGTWATKLTIAVKWSPLGLTSVILQPGSGAIVQWVRSTRVQTGKTTVDTATVCAITLPDFAGTWVAAGETYDIRFPNSLFDDGSIPPFTFPGKLSDMTPNAKYTSESTAVLLGLSMPGAATAPWPTSATGFIGVDGGLPGVVAVPATGPVPGSSSAVYSNPPVDPYYDRADHIDVVVRQVTQLSGGASDCDHISGTVTIPQIADTSGKAKWAIDSHVIGCSLTDGTPCTDAQAGFLDSTEPVFTPSGATAFTSVRIPDASTCADVRALLP